MKYKDIQFPFVLHMMNSLTRIVVANSSHGPRFIFESIARDAMGQPYWQPLDELSELSVTMIHDLASRMFLQLQGAGAEIPSWWTDSDPAESPPDVLDADILEPLEPVVEDAEPGEAEGQTS